MSEYGPDYEAVEIESVTVTTLVPYADGPEFREYTPEPENLQDVLILMDDPEHAERVIDVEIERS